MRISNPNSCPSIPSAPKVLGSDELLWRPRVGDDVDTVALLRFLHLSEDEVEVIDTEQHGPEESARLRHTFPGEEAVIPDQLRSGVTAPCRYEPGIQRTYEEMAGHYNTTVLPARPGRP